MVSNGQNTPKISLLDVITQIFAKQFSANSLNFRFRSFDCASHSKFVKLFGQFHEFFSSTLPKDSAVSDSLDKNKYLDTAEIWSY